MKVLFHVFGLPIYFFGTMIAIGIFAGLYVANLEAKRKKLDADKMYDVAVYSIISAIIGARIFYILFYNLPFYLANPMEIIKINEGGLSIHGGLIGAIGFAFYYIKRHKLSFLKYADAMAPGIILGQGIGRIGCDVFGKVMAMPWPWGVFYQGQLLHPAQVYEFLLNYAVFFFLWRKRKTINYDGQLFAWYLILFTINRSIVELFRNNPQVAGSFSVSYLLSFILMLGSLIFMFYIKKGRAEISVDTKKGSSISFEFIKDLLITLALVVVSLFVFYIIQG